MSYRLLLAIAVLSGMTASVNSQDGSIAAHPIVASNLELLDVWLQAEVAYQQQPGLVVGIVYEGKLLWAKSFGFADVEKRTPVTTDTVFRIGSQSKQFTAIAIMQLHAAGKLSVFDPVKKYIPEFKNKGVSDQPITVEQLLTHTAGLPSEGGETLHWTEFDFPTPRQIAEQAKCLELDYGPERQRKYSNFGYALAGQIVEIVSGQSFEAYIKSQILDPLKMNSTSVDLARVDTVRLALATGYGRRMPDGEREVIASWHAKGMTPAFGMCSTLNDLAAFVCWQMRVANSESPEILAPSTFRSMRRAHWVDPDWSGGWGLGFQVSRLAERTLYGHYGQVPGFFSSTYVDPAQKLGVIVLANSMDAQPYLVQPRSIPERVFGLIGSAIERAKKGDPAATADGTWPRLYGRYRSIWEDVYVFNYEGNLVMVNPSASEPQTAVFKLKSLDPGGFKFRITDGPDQQLVAE